MLRLVNHGEYADGTDRRTDRRQTVTLRLRNTWDHFTLWHSRRRPTFKRYDYRFCLLWHWWAFMREKLGLHLFVNHTCSNVSVMLFLLIMFNNNNVTLMYRVSIIYETINLPLHWHLVNVTCKVWNVFHSTLHISFSFFSYYRKLYFSTWQQDRHQTRKNRQRNMHTIKQKNEEKQAKTKYAV